MTSLALPGPAALPARAGLGAALALGGLALGMGEGALHLARTWASSPTYNHGALVPLISAWLIWQGWRAGDRPAGWPPALVGCASAAALYALGSAADARLLQHAGIASFAGAAAASVLGRTVAIRHRFALLFLLAMVPVGEGLVPVLQEVTARGIMALTDLFGVLALRRGLEIVTPAGVFEVAEACAGLRFVVASGVTGALCAHLFFTSVWKQAVMLAACLIVPVLANVLRAGGTVLIASATDMRVAAGADHLFYGWGFFAVVTGALVLVALRFAEPGAPRLPTPPTGAGARTADPLLCGVAAGGLGLLAGFV